MKRFQDTFTIEGHWWFPSNPSLVIPGILTHSPSEIKLHLMGVLTNETTFVEQFENEIILGLSTDGKPITLHKCSGIHYEFTGTEFSTSDYIVVFIFIGKHFSSRAEIQFKQIHLHLTHFDEWLRRSGFQSSGSNPFSISYSLPETIKFQLNNQFSLSISFVVTSNRESVGEREEGVKQRAYFTVESNETVSFFSYEPILFDIKKFLSLACLHPVFPTQMVSSYPITENIPNTEIFFSHPTMPDKIPEIHFSKMLFTFNDISNNLQQFFQNWINHREILEPIHNLYFATIYNAHTYLDQKFLQLSHALESYHRRTSNETEKSPQDHQTLLDDILSSVPDSHKEWLEGKLQHSNEISLRKRLKRLLEQFPFVLEGYEHSQGDFVNFIVDTRNYLTHYSNISAKANLDDHDGLYTTCKYMELLIESCLLLTLGFTHVDIERFIANAKILKGMPPSPVSGH